MIRSFKSPVAKAVFRGENPKGFPAPLKVARRKLEMLNAAVRLDDLRFPPKNHLEALKGDRKGQHSIRINDQYRICFVWTEAGQLMSISSTIIRRSRNMPRKLPPMHPGEVLREEFMEPLNLSAYAIAKACGVPRTRIERIADEKIGITADTAVRLARLFGSSAEFWLNLQARYDVLTAERRLASELKKITPIEEKAA